VKQWWESNLFQGMPNCLSLQAQGFENWFDEMKWGDVWQCSKEKEQSSRRITGLMLLKKDGP
jgi:hypothetical protein